MRSHFVRKTSKNIFQSKILRCHKWRLACSYLILKGKHHLWFLCIALQEGSMHLVMWDDSMHLVIWDDSMHLVMRDDGMHLAIWDVSLYETTITYALPREDCITYTLLCESIVLLVPRHAKWLYYTCLNRQEYWIVSLIPLHTRR